MKLGDVERAGKLVTRKKEIEQHLTTLERGYGEHACRLTTNYVTDRGNHADFETEVPKATMLALIKAQLTDVNDRLIELGVDITTKL